MQASSSASNTCPMCGRVCALTKHHLIPKKLHRRKHFKKHYTRMELSQCVMVCRKCHDGIHALYDEMTLAREFKTVESLQEDEQLRKHYTWVAKQKIR